MPGQNCHCTACRIGALRIRRCVTACFACVRISHSISLSKYRFQCHITIGNINRINYIHTIQGPTAKAIPLTVVPLYCGSLLNGILHLCRLPIDVILVVSHSRCIFNVTPLISHLIRRHRHLRRCIQQRASFLTVLRIASQASLISFDIIRVVIMFTCQPSGISIIYLNRNRNDQLIARVVITVFRNDIPCRTCRCVVEALYSNCLSIARNILLDSGGDLHRIFPSVSVRTFPSYCRCLNSNVVRIAVQYKLLRQRIPQNCTLICRHLSSRDGVGDLLEHVLQRCRVCCSEIVITTLCSCSKVPVPVVET